MHKSRVKIYHLLFLFLCFFLSAQGQEIDSFIKRVSLDKNDFYHVDLKTNENSATGLPIGMFDSGTGGLTVLDALLNFDEFVVGKDYYEKGGDGINDFENERFIYLGDQANMPYGNYSSMGRTPFLKELILKDALFLLGNNYYQTHNESIWQNDKQAVKVIVIACNTATAYGKVAVDQMLSQYGNNTKVIGVIDAGVNGALSTLKREEDASVAVIATNGTVASNGYLNTFLSLKDEKNDTGNLLFFQQTGEGIAGAIDEDINFIDRSAKSLRKNYKGPSLNNPHLRIKPELLSIYNFDSSENSLLFEKSGSAYTEIQLNSPENYFRFHLVNLCEQIKRNQSAPPLKTLILGCTHYPYYSSFIKSFLKELYNLKTDGEYVYRAVLSEQITLIDPALNTAKEVHCYLAENNLLNNNGNVNQSEFFISVPNLFNEKVELDSMKNFTYAYKYGRDVSAAYDTKIVPMNQGNLNEKVRSRIRETLPAVFEIMNLNQ